MLWMRNEGQRLNHLPIVSKLVSDGGPILVQVYLIPKLKPFPLYQQGVEMKDIPDSEVRGWVREIGLITFSIS